jgi:hypothetical protein
MAKIKKPKKLLAATKRTAEGKKHRRIGGSQTREPFEQDSKRRIGQYGGAGEPPIKK